MRRQFLAGVLEEMEKVIPNTQKKGPSNKLGLSPTGRYEDDALKGNHRLREMK